MGRWGLKGRSNLSYLHEVVVGAIKIFVQLNDQTLEEGRELPFLLTGLWESDRDCGGRTGTMDTEWATLAAGKWYAQRQSSVPRLSPGPPAHPNQG